MGTGWVWHNDRKKAYERDPTWRGGHFAPNWMPRAGNDKNGKDLRRKPPNGKPKK